MGYYYCAWFHPFLTLLELIGLALVVIKTPWNHLIRHVPFPRGNSWAIFPTILQLDSCVTRHLKLANLSRRNLAFCTMKSLNIIVLCYLIARFSGLFNYDWCGVLGGTALLLSGRSITATSGLMVIIVGCYNSTGTGRLGEPWIRLYGGYEGYADVKG